MNTTTWVFLSFYLIFQVVICSTLQLHPRMKNSDREHLYNMMVGDTIYNKLY